VEAVIGGGIPADAARLGFQREGCPGVDPTGSEREARERPGLPPRASAELAECGGGAQPLVIPAPKVAQRGLQAAEGPGEALGVHGKHTLEGRHGTQGEPGPSLIDMLKRQFGAAALAVEALRGEVILV